MTPYRWNAAKDAWEFHESAFGGWCALRIGLHVSTRPMSFAEGFRHLVKHSLVRGHESETQWLADAADNLDLSYVPAQ